MQQSLLSNDHFQDWDVAVYVRKDCIDLQTFRNDCMEYIGGQKIAQCKAHRIPLIIASPPIGEKRPTERCYMVSFQIFAWL